MRLRIYVQVDGHPVPRWGENTEGCHAGAPSRGGHLIVGGPGPAETQRIAQRLHQQRERAKAREARP